MILDIEVTNRSMDHKYPYVQFQISNVYNTNGSMNYKY